MPVVTVYVAGVRTLHVRNDVTRFEVYTRKSQGSIWSEMFSTTDSLKASLCQRAYELGVTVTIWARDTRYGPEIVTVALAEVAA